MRVSRSVRDVAYKAMQARELLQKKLGREPNVREISEAVGLPQATVTLALESVVEPVSLYEPVYSDGGDTIYVMDQVGETGCEENWISSIQFRDTVSKLSDREKKSCPCATWPVNAGRGCGEIGISQAQVSRLEKNALERIKKQL